MTNKAKIFIACLLVVFGVVGRLVPHPWNVAPIAALALFSGAYLGRTYAIIVPLGAMLVSDMMLGFAAWPVTWSVYFSFFVIGLFGLVLNKNRNAETVLAVSITGSVLFFLITNWAVWQFAAWYPHTLAGLIDCYTMALPFFRNTLVGDLFYTGSLFGFYELFRVASIKKYLILEKNQL